MGKRGLFLFLGSIVGVGVGCAVALGPVVRSEVAKEGAKRRLAIEIGGVRPGFFAVRLRDVRVRPEGVEGVEVTMPEVRVELTRGLRPREILADGGRITLDGEPEAIVEKLKAWRASGEPSGGGAAADKGGGPELRLTGATVAWTHATGVGIEATGVGVARDDGGYRFTVDEGRVTSAEGSVEAHGVRLETDRKLALSSLRGENAVVVVRSAKGELPLVKDVKDAPGTDDAKKDEVAPPPLPLAVAPKKAKGKKAPPKPVVVAPAPESNRPLFSLPDPRKIRNRAMPFERELVKRLPIGSTVDVRAVRLELHVRSEVVTLGPGPFSIARGPESVRVSFSTDDGTGKDGGAREGTPLSTTLVVPVNEGDLLLELSGGPVSLSVLGVQAGAFGLEDVERAKVAARGQLVLAKGGESLTFDGRIHAENVNIKQPRIALDVMRNLDVVVAGHGLLTSEGVLRIDGADVEMGQLRATAHGTVQQTPDFAVVALAGEIAPAACQGIVASIPEAVLPTLKNARIAGKFGATGRLSFDTRRLDDLVLDYKVASSCRITDVPVELSRQRFAHPFTHKIYGPDGKVKEEVTGPGTSSWTDLEHVSPFMQVAVMTTEDGAFFRHHGFNHPGFRNALVANLKARRFVRGASTITMQLAKNVFLSRDKTLGRKLEELVLTDYLEQVFRKEEMMELYLNVIEFGPNIYGITKAADHFYGRKPEELNLAESMYLATLLPSPVRYHKIYDRGEVPKGWLDHVRMLMGIAEKTSRITPNELAEGLQEDIVFTKPGAPRPPPRAPVSGSRASGDDTDWQSVD